MPSNQQVPQGGDKAFTAWLGRQRSGAGSHWTLPAEWMWNGIPRLYIRQVCCEIQGLSPFPFEVHFVLFWNAASLG